MPSFETGQVVTVFRSRLHPGGEDAYSEHAARMADLARTMPGMIDFKTFAADDGERVTVVTFADEDSQAAWRHHAEHRGAQAAGRAGYYAEYSLQVCTTVRTRTFARPDA